MLDDDIEAFIATDYPRVVRAVAVACGDRRRAEDAVQDTLVDLWVRRHEVRDLAGWVTTVSLNRARSRWRTAAAEERAFARLAQQAATGATSSPVDGVDRAVAEALSKLPRAQREVLALHYLLDLSVTDVAGRLCIAEGTVKAHLHRGRNALRTALGADRSATEEVDHV